MDIAYCGRLSTVGFFHWHSLSCCFALLLQAHCGQLCHTSAMVLKMPPVRSRNKFSSDFFIPFLKWNTSVLCCWEHLCCLFLRSQHVEKDTDGPSCCTKAVSKSFSCSKTLPLSWRKACMFWGKAGNHLTRACRMVCWKAGICFRFFEGTHCRKCVISWLDRCCTLTQVPGEICLCFSTGMSVCCCWIQTLMLLSSETEWGSPAFWRGGRGCLAGGWCDKPHKHFNECCLGQWWKSQFLNLELKWVSIFPEKLSSGKKSTYVS